MSFINRGKQTEVVGACYKSCAHGRNEKFLITSLCMLCCSADAESEA